MVYDSWRVNGGPTQHAPTPTAVTADVLEIGFVFAIAILAFSFALIVPGYRGWSRLFFIIRVIVTLFIGSAILLGVLGQEWESAEISTRTPYKAFTKTEIHAKVGMKIGLASVNITLKGEPVDQRVDHTEYLNFTEHIDYNERFHWAWRQGRFGFGPQAGRISRELRAAQFRGLPLPVLWIAEYFALDGELIRWGRSYRTAGWFSYQVLWTAFPCWLIANILSVVVLFYAGWMFILTGTFMLVSNIIWATIKWGTQPLVIPFEDAALHTHYGPSFWLVLSGGIISFLCGAIIVAMDLWVPQMIADFFGNDVLQDSEQYFHHEEDEVDEEQLKDAENHRVSHRGGVQSRIRKSKFQRTARRIPRPATRKLLAKRKSIADSPLKNPPQPPRDVIYSNDAFEAEEEAAEVVELDDLGTNGIAVTVNAYSPDYRVIEEADEHTYDLEINGTTDTVNYNVMEVTEAEQPSYDLETNETEATVNYNVIEVTEAEQPV